MRAAASLAINGTGADAAVAPGDLLRARFVRLTDDGIGANSLLMGVFPEGLATYEMYAVAHPVSAQLPKDEAELQALGLAELPSSIAQPVVAVDGEAALISRAFAPGWYYFRQVSAGADAKRADLYPVAVSAFELP